jgi:hypothetical protein
MKCCKCGKKQHQQRTNSCSDRVQKMVSSYPSCRTYLWKDTGEIVHIHSYYEDGTVSVLVLARDNPKRTYRAPDGHGVFGVDPDSLAALPVTD